MGSLHLVCVVLFASVFCQVYSTNQNEIAIQRDFTSPQNIHSRVYQAETGEDVTITCQASKTEKENFLSVCVKDMRPDYQDNGNCRFGSAVLQTCRYNCSVDLTLTNIQPTKASNYCCDGYINAYHPLLKCIQIDVNDRKHLRFSQSPKRFVNVTEGQRLKLYCAGTGYPEPSYTWTHDEKPINSTDGYLYVEKVSHLNGGIYQCIIRNRFETRKSNKVSVEIAYISWIEKNKKPFVGGVGGFIAVCLVAGLTIWFFKKRHKDGNGVDYRIIDDTVSPPTTPTHVNPDQQGRENFDDSGDTQVFNGGVHHDDEPYGGDQSVPDVIVQEVAVGNGTLQETPPETENGPIPNGGVKRVDSTVTIVQMPHGATVNIIHSDNVITQVGDNNKVYVGSGLSSSASSENTCNDGDHVSAIHQNPSMENSGDDVSYVPSPNISMENSRNDSEIEMKEDKIQINNSPEIHDIDMQKGSPEGLSEHFGRSDGVNTSCKTVSETIQNEEHGKLSQGIPVQDGQPSANADCDSINESGGDTESVVQFGCHGDMQIREDDSNATWDTSIEGPENNAVKMDGQKLGNYDMPSTENV